MGGVGVEAHLEALVQNINGGPESAQEYGMRWLDILLQVGVVRQKYGCVLLELCNSTKWQGHEC